MSFEVVQMWFCGAAWPQCLPVTKAPSFEQPAQELGFASGKSTCLLRVLSSGQGMTCGHPNFIFGTTVIFNYPGYFWMDLG